MWWLQNPIPRGRTCTSRISRRGARRGLPPCSPNQGPFALHVMLMANPGGILSADRGHGRAWMMVHHSPLTHRRRRMTPAAPPEGAESASERTEPARAAAAEPAPAWTPIIRVSARPPEGGTADHQQQQ
jgi:hypothetical protein